MNLFKKDRVTLGDCEREPRKFLRAVRRGATDREAAEKAGVSMLTVRSWTRDPDFARLYDQARQGKGGANFVAMSSIRLDDSDPAWDEMLRERGRQWIADRYSVDEYGRIR